MIIIIGTKTEKLELRERETERETDRQTDRQTEAEAETQRQAERVKNDYNEGKMIVG